MCPDCERLKKNPSLTGRHLVDPDDPGRHAVDMRGNATCPKCETLWHKPEGKRPWQLVAPAEPKAKSSRRSAAKPTGSASQVTACAPFVSITGCSAFAQNLPPPSRTVFKCEVNGRIVYSDSPCLGAEKLEVEPTRGLNKSTGRERQGADVRREHQREGMAEAVRPLTGKDPKQLDTFGHRMKLAPKAQRECRHLDVEIPIVEADEKLANKATISEVQHKLFGLRKRFRELGC